MKRKMRAEDAGDLILVFLEIAIVATVIISAVMML